MWLSGRFKVSPILANESFKNQACAEYRNTGKDDGRICLHPTALMRLRVRLP